MFIRAVLSLSVVLLAVSCGKGNFKGRYISETDTSFSKDIRDVSARINKDPEKAELYYLRGNAFYYQDKYKDATMDFNSAVELDSNNATYHFRLGETILKLDTVDNKKARLHLTRAIELAPKLLEAQLLLAKFMIARQEYDAAEKMLKKITNEPDAADKAFLLLGISKKEQKDTIAALTYFDKAMQLNPQNYDASMQEALIKSALHDKNVISYFDRVISINEYSDEAWYGKGLYYQQQGKYKDAVTCYDKASLINGAHLLSRYNSAVIYSIFEDWERAEEWCNKTLDLDPEFANALSLRGFTFEKRNNKKAAIADYKAALSIDPKNVPASEGLKTLGN